jgi:hypothetical protein
LFSCARFFLSKNRPDPFKHKTISIEDLLKKPDERPPKIVLIFRGLPGSGKSYLTNLIKVLNIGVWFLIFCEKNFKSSLV